MCSPHKNDFSVDGVYGGRLLVEQSNDGYRFSVDALLLTWFAAQGNPSKVAMDVGTGCGIVGLGLGVAGVSQKIVMLERQRLLAELAHRNVRLNGLVGVCEVIRGDVSDLPFSHEKKLGVDLIVSNPPFWAAGSGRPPANEERRIANQETSCDLALWVRNCAKLLASTRGRLAVVFTARRLEALVGAFAKAGMAGTRLKLIHPSPKRPAELVLFEGRQGGADRLVVEPPLFLKSETGTDTDDAVEILEGRFSQQLHQLPDRRAPKAGA